MKLDHEELKGGLVLMVLSLLIGRSGVGGATAGLAPTRAETGSGFTPAAASATTDADWLVSETFSWALHTQPLATTRLLAKISVKSLLEITKCRK